MTADAIPSHTPAIRPFGPARDVPLLVELLASVEAHDHAGEDTTEEAVREQLTLPGHDPARDRWVAVDPGDETSLIGWSFVWRVPEESLATLDIAVHPRWRRRGVGRALLALAMERARALGATTAGIYVSARDPDAIHFALARGFQQVSANTLLRVEANVPLPAPVFPDDYTLRPYPEINSLAVLADAFNRCYAGLWGHHMVTEAVVAEWVPTLRLDHLHLLLAPDGSLAGMCRVERPGDAVPYIDAPGVVPKERGGELYGPLLLAACSALRREGPRAIEVESWGDTEETLARYQHLGFGVVRQALAFECSLAVAPAP